MNIEKYVTLFSNEITRKGYRPKSIKNYVVSVRKFLFYFNDKVEKPTEINEQMIKNYLSLFKDHNTQRSIHSALKCFFKYTMKQPNKFRYIEYCKRSRRLPIVLSMDEMHQLILAAENLKHKTIICLMYSTAIRVSEVINLKIKDIDSKRMVINIIDAKGGKDRQVTLDKYILTLLREYYKQYQPKEYLFNGQNSLKYSERSIAQFLQKYSLKAGISKNVHPHLIRHCSATHLIENGTDMSIIQRLLGHSNIKTTHIYGHISNNIISKINTPLMTLANNFSNNRVLN